MYQIKVRDLIGSQEWCTGCLLGSVERLEHCFDDFMLGDLVQGNIWGVMPS